LTMVLPRGRGSSNNNLARYSSNLRYINPLIEACFKKILILFRSGDDGILLVSKQ